MLKKKKNWSEIGMTPPKKALDHGQSHSGPEGEMTEN